MKIKNRVILAATFAGISVLSPIVRFFTESSSHFPIYPQPGLFAASLLLCFASFCLLFSAFSLTSMLQKTKIPYEAIPNAFIILIAGFAQVLNFLDIGFQRSTQVRANPSFLQVSVFKRQPLFKTAYAEKGAKIIGSTNFEEIFDQFKQNPVLFPMMTAFILVLAGVLLVLLIKNFKNVLISFGFRPANTKWPKDAAEGHVPLWIHVLSALFGAAYAVLGIAYLASGNGRMNKLDLVAPASWVFVKSGINSDITKMQEKQAVSAYRASIQLPEDRDWLDQREDPVYPLVTASKEVVRAYNAGYNASFASRAAPKFSGEAPSIFVMLIESFSPTPFYMDPGFIQQNSTIYKGAIYDTNYLPHLDRVQREGVAFSGLSSNSLPTFGGWFSFVAGDYQANYGSSMALDSYNDLDDLPSSVREHDYFSQYISTSPLNFDGKMQYAFRGHEQLRGPKQLAAFPKWFDEFHQYFPTAEQARDLGLEGLPKPSSWVCDRITRQQVIKALDDYNESKPLFTLWTTVDTHTPFKGFDSHDQYDAFTVGKGMSSPYSEQGMSDRYSTILRYTDEQLGRVYDHLKKTRNNTIFVVLGDHGARDMNTFQHNNTVKSATFSDACRGKAFGNEELFTTTGVISYLGDDPQVKALFEDHVGQVFTGPTDQQDMVYTIQALVNYFSGSEHVTARQGRNLLQLFSAPLASHLSIRNTGLSLEVATESYVIRSNYLTDHGAIVIQNAAYPTCIAEKNESIVPLDRELFNKYLLISSLFTKLSLENRNFNYRLRDTSCVQSGSCNFPALTPAYKSPVLINCYITMPCALLVLCVLITALCQVLSRRLSLKYDYIVENDRWWTFKNAKREISEISVNEQYI